ncbi:hypothetical protein EV421DRAFT_694812 [Armillaria borealis]|uniref:Secreted protein n=1 Tax=Armillaria borealis TaxID=47425 RepID=A0AA39N171_9AGAR|nr:hypothetical protein EV421DRAFT_694812 [Armillaria borealis]
MWTSKLVASLPLVRMCTVSVLWWIHTAKTDTGGFKYSHRRNGRGLYNNISKCVLNEANHTHFDNTYLTSSLKTHNGADTRYSIKRTTGDIFCTSYGSILNGTVYRCTSLRVTGYVDLLNTAVIRIRVSAVSLFDGIALSYLQVKVIDQSRDKSVDVQFSRNGRAKDQGTYLGKRKRVDIGAGARHD